ncbi:hypothetical protein PAXRUDRAFT_832228 [Paxillus rubicundulus Ve08.2h10]|uniref:Uncharacterized protein n=1 Tax=Paxillus rubicundulus Ve08.2h10 TaxID=930991 RepID=A0A0D0DKZ1_9AGAM|nr:hypothetical protein PAXRUDRAFT_832228 [Paxillus rubicundulus Ve08.2h10]
MLVALERMSRARHLEYNQGLSAQAQPFAHIGSVYVRLTRSKPEPGVLRGPITAFQSRTRGSSQGHAWKLAVDPSEDVHEFGLFIRHHKSGNMRHAQLRLGPRHLHVVDGDPFHVI